MSGQGKMTKPRKHGAFQFVERGPIRGEARMVRAGLALKDERVIRYQLLVNRFQQMETKRTKVWFILGSLRSLL